MKCVAVIPARMAATRFPGKPLENILGIPMVEHVRRRLLLSKYLDDVIVATCDQEIMDLVLQQGGKAVLTKDSHERCTDRVAEAASSIDADVIVNVQGDEPLVMPEMMEQVTGPLLKDKELQCVNLVTEIVDKIEFNDPNVPKVVANIEGDLLYISREPIPSIKKADTNDYLKLKQLGIIAFRREFLQLFARLDPTPLEQVESVDMMRAVEHGYRVKLVETKHQMIGVDVPSDVQRVEKVLSSDPLINKYI